MLWVTITLLSALTLAVCHVMYKKLLEDIDSFDLTVIVGLVAFIDCLIVLPFVDVRITPLQFGVTLVISILAFLGFLCLNYAFKHNDASLVSPLLNLSPLVLLIIAFFWLGESISMIEGVGMLFLLSGGYMLTVDGFRKLARPFTSMQPKYFIAIAGPLVLWSIAHSLQRWLLRSMDTWTYVFYFSVTVFIVNFITFLFAGKKKILASFNRHRWLIIISGLVAFFSDVMHIFALSFDEVPAALIITLKRVSTIFVIIMGGTLLKEKSIGYKLVSALIMIAGAYIVASS